jgi:hypothetical protein
VASVISAIIVGIALANPKATVFDAAIATWLAFYLSALAMWITVCFGTSP